MKERLYGGPKESIIYSKTIVQGIQGLSDTRRGTVLSIAAVSKIFFPFWSSVGEHKETAESKILLSSVGWMFILL